VSLRATELGKTSLARCFLYTVAKKRDWPTVRERYVQSNLTVPELSVETSIPQSTLETHCSREGWVVMRREYGERVARETRELGAKKEAKDRVDLLDSSYEIITTLRDTIEKISAKIEGEGFSEKLGATEAHRLLERLSSLSTSFEKMARAINLLEGGTSSRVQVTLADILGASASSR